ncbi:GlcG/HbpS family heme-binding protein [Cohaesibacter celericrescens]|uniref:Heme-binding protein n=1 Tax=Cohaesibacter celericrescens TaxID=2067669 RepID=A0A2N5XML2_9HYPH|nr:heme-binding protein [Cohaesibacter celericrescens]PLW75715.1 hypothetical protein C0081_18935 [Cohaesibacter celericrescens]
MRTVEQIELADATAAVAAAKAEATSNGWAVSVAVTDAGGHLLAYERMDGAAASSGEIACEKARTSSIFRAPTGGLEDKIKDRLAILSLPNGMPMRGGIPIVVNGTVVGAVGVSGLAPHQDDQVATAAVAMLSA